MKRFMLIGLVAVLLLLSIAPMQAQDTAGDPRALAQRLPGDTFAYIGFRTDQAFFNTINDLITRLAQSMGETVPEGGLLAQLDAQIQEATNGRYNFETGVRSWLGGSVVLALPSAQQSFAMPNPQVLLAEVTDEDALIELLDLVTEGDESIEKEVGDGFTYYRSSSFAAPSYLVSNGTLYLSDAAAIDMVFSANRMAALAENPLFTEAYAALPNGDYAMFGYLNGGELVSLLSGFTSPESLPFPIDFDALRAAVNVQSFGGALLDDRTFALDFALAHGDATIAQALNLPEPTGFAFAPIDPALASIAPIDTFLYTAGSSQGSIARDMFAYMEAFAPAFAELIEPVDAEAALNIRAGLPTIINVVRGFVTDVFGVPFDELMLMMDGQNVTFTRMVDGQGSVEFAQAYQNLRPQYNEALITGVQELLTRFEIPFTYDVDRITLDGEALSRILVSEMRNLDDMDDFNDFDEEVFEMLPPVNYVFAINNDYLILGTEESVNFVMNGNRMARLNSTAAYQHQVQHLLSNATSFSYVAMAPLLAMSSDGEFDGAQAFESFAWSTASSETASLLRFTMALSE